MKKITIGILAHVDAGKTTLAEALLYQTGKIRTQGRVDHKNTVMDAHPLEKDRGITIFAGEAAMTVGDTEITLLDTPGHVDFSAETERTMGVMDYAILVISAPEGVQAHTRTVGKLLALYGIPTFIFVTKCDMLRRSREDMTRELEREFPGTVCFDENGPTDPEKTALCDEELLEEYMASGTLTRENLIAAIRKRRIFPCFFGSGLKNEGVETLAEALADYTAERSFPAAFGAKVYKILHEKNERITKLRVTGGVLRVRDSVEYNGISEKINQIRLYTGSKYVTAEEAPAGTVCAVTGLTASSAGMGFGSEQASAAAVLEPVIRYRIVLPEGSDPRVVLPKLRSLEEENPELKITYHERLGEFHCALMGTVQAEIFKSLTAERFDLDIRVTEGRVIYKETIENTVEGVGHFEPLRHYAEVHLLMEPGERGSGLVFGSTCSENELDRSWQRLILTHLAEKTHVGVVTGSPITDMKITLARGRAHLKHTEGGDFRQATYRAVRQGLMQARTVLLEPYESFRLEVPANLTGRAMTDIRLMGGKAEPPMIEGETAILRGKAPVVTMDGYMTELAAYSGGRGRLSLVPAGYDLCHNAEEVIAESRYEAEHDLENPADSVFCAHGAGYTVKWHEVKNYMHLESCLTEKKAETAARRPFSIDEKELEAILLREFGPVKTEIRHQQAKTVGAEETNVPYRERTRVLIVDGYNVIFNWPDLTEIAETDLEGARTKLCRVLSNYGTYTKQRVIVVFDGYKVPGNQGEKNEEQGISVVFTKENETGDNYIERLITEIGANELVRVVTSDGLIQLSAVRTGVLRMSSAEFGEEVERIEREVTELIERKTREQHRQTKN